MRTQFSFLSIDGLYEATLPRGFGAERGKTSVVAVNGIARSVQHLSGQSAAGVFRGKDARGTLRAGDGTAVALYEQPDPYVRFLYWNAGDGLLWTQHEPDVEDESAMTALLHALQVEAARGGVRIRIAEPLRGGDVRDLAERDSVMFYGRPRAVPDTVTFTFSGPFSSDREITGSDVSAVTRGTAVGIDVTCDGPSSQLEAMRAAADEIAGSVSAVR